MAADSIELTLTGFAYGGDAIGRIPGEGGGPARVVFVPFGIPGERARVRLLETRGGPRRGEIIQILEAAPERVTPRCKHFGTCGGCHYQHISYAAQLKAKAEVLRDQFRRIGHITDAPVGEAIPSTDPWNYRNQVQFHLTREGRVGYVAADGRSILAITECHLPEAGINSLWPTLEIEPGSQVERISVRQGSDDELMVVLESDSAELPELETEAGISVVHTFEEHAVVMAGDEHITIEVLGRRFRVSAPSFFQVNTPMAEKMVMHILERTRAVDPDSVIVDAYCGAGLFSAFLAPLCKRLIGIESAPSACEDLAFNLDEFDNVELYEDAAENVLPALVDARELLQPALVVLDPPRAGLAPKALEALLRMQPATIAYVSCDPATLARDARRLLDGGYRLQVSTPFDLFPQTYHIESISWFEKEERSR